MHLFICAGEPSGDLHAANLIRAIRGKAPAARIVGFGCERMRQAGAKLLHPFTNLAFMGFGKVVLKYPHFLALARQADDYFRTERPDAVVLVDYPVFNFALAKRAHAAGIPVHFFVPPQIWAWKQWRVKKVRRWFDTVLTALPFEDEWYRSKGVNTHYIGHPYFDELPRQQLDPTFLATERARAGERIALLPGSRKQEVLWNVPLMLDAARRIHTARPDVRFLVAAFSELHARMIREMATGSNLPIEVHSGRTPEIIELATACVAVSGSVGLELLYRTKPAVVLYRVNAFYKFLHRLLIKCKYISLVNLLAGEELYPEFVTTGGCADTIAGHVLHWLNDPAARDHLVSRLAELQARVAVPGACDRAAEFLVNSVASPTRRIAPAA